MREWTVGSAEKDQRLSRYLQRKLPGAPSSFLYKMLRKKNIKLNGKKASGSELLHGGDLVTFFLSDETIRGFGGILPGEIADKEEQKEALLEYERAYRQFRSRVGSDGILYEDADLLAVKKPVGVLSQKASDNDCKDICDDSDGHGAAPFSLSAIRSPILFSQDMGKEHIHPFFSGLN